jgi:hypothetical protein
MSHPPSSQCAAKDFAATYSCWPVSDATGAHGRFRRPLYRRFVAMITAAHPGSWIPTGMGGGNDELPAQFAPCVGYFRSSACGSTRAPSPRPGRPYEARRRAPIPKKNRREGLLLGRRSNVLLNREVTQNASTSGPPSPESGACRERGRSGESSEHRPLGTQAVMRATATLAHLIEQPRTTGLSHGRIRAPATNTRSYVGIDALQIVDLTTELFVRRTSGRRTGRMAAIGIT